MITTSEQTDELMVALAKAQSKFGAAIKGSVNPAFRSKYADITSIIDATLEHLNAEGIVLMQHPSLEFKADNQALVTMTTRLQLKGQWIQSDLSAPAMMRDRFDAQSVGSACTYLSRYQMQNILVVPREDDDGQRAVGAGTHEEAQAVGKAKIKALEDKMGKKAAPAGEIPSLFVALQPSGLYAVTGPDDLLRPLYKQFSKQWYQQDRCFMVSEEGLEQIKFQAEQSNPTVLITTLKAPK